MDQSVLAGELVGPTGTRVIRVIRALPHSLVVEIDGVVPTAEFDSQQVRLGGSDRWIELGSCRYFPHSGLQQRRASDPAEQPGHGRLVPLTSVIDFSALIEKGLIVPLEQRTSQLPTIYKRKDAVSPHFRAFTSDHGYDLQVFRSLLDDIDRSVASEPVATAELVRTVAIDLQWKAFCQLFDNGLEQLETFALRFDKRENELHGYYFRKHMWDLILCSGFFQRTNLKPRGYAGDSEMMRMIYEDRFDGPTIFSRFMHRHPIRTAAAQAVRNRRALLADLVGTHLKKNPMRIVRVMSVACGPAREIVDLVTSPEIAQRLSFTLLDQDSEALAEAGEMVAWIGRRLGVAPIARTVQESVRRMLRSADLADRLGRFDVVYSMGLFDYLVGPVARAVLVKLYELLEPGGELVIGNFHVDSPTRVYMEYWMDWVLFYRTEEDMLALAEGLPGAKVSVTFEETRSQMFLRVTKA